MNMGWYQLIVHLPLRRHERFVLRTRCIVENLEVHMVITLLEALHDGILCLHSMNIFYGLERGNKDCIGRGVE